VAVHLAVVLEGKFVLRLAVLGAENVGGDLAAVALCSAGLSSGRRGGH